MELVGGIAAGALGLGGLAFSARYTWWRRRVEGVPVLMYHHVTNQLNGTRFAKLRVTTEAFARQLDFLLARGYRSITLARAMTGRLPPRAVVLTFDDGYRNFYTQAWPLLRARGMTATVFLVTGCLGGYNRWDQDKGEPSEPIMDAAMVRELAAQGVEFGGHSHSHRNLAQLNERELVREVTGCQKVLSDLLGHPARSFSYPYGLWNRRVAQAVETAGFDQACLTRPGKLDAATPAYAVPRIIVKRSDDMLDFRHKLAKARSRL